MKKIISLLVLVLALTVAMSVSAFAAKEFALAEGYTAPEGITVTPAADRIAVTVPATANADYSVLLVNGSELPTSETGIAYINQVEATGTSVAFNILPKLTSCGDECTIYIGSNAAGAELISIPVTYLEPAPTGCNVTLMNGATTVASTLATDAEGNVTLPADTAFNGSNLVSGYNLTLYSWVTVTSTNATTGYPVEGEEYLAGAEAAATALEGKTLYAKYVCDRVIGDVDASGLINGTDVTAVKYNVTGRYESLQKNAGKTMYVINK